jgi:predicted DNA-binding antitoxin AbrB/MazE fold protein
MKPTRKPIEAIVEEGRLRPLQRLPLAEHQHVWITILSEQLSAQQVAQLAAQSPSFQFLADPAEDLYSLHDGQPV